MAIAAECTTKGTSGWEVFFNHDGGITISKGNKAHEFPDLDSVQYFLMGYETGLGECDDCDCVEESTAELKVTVDTSELDEFAEKMERLAAMADKFAGEKNTYKTHSGSGGKVGLFTSYEDAMSWVRFCDLASGVYDMRIEEFK